VIDYAGVVFAGIDEESARLVRKTIESMGGKPHAAIWGTGNKTSVMLAAMANGTAAHSLDFDDTNALMIAHPSIQLLPGLFALGEYNRLSGFEILASYVIGFETGAALGIALNPRHAAQGWLPIGTIGPLMQAAACSRLLNLDSKKTQMAIGIATNIASGIRCNNGTMAKPFLAGHAASDGVLAAVLAREGMTASPAALEDRYGYFENFSRGDPADLERASNALGERFHIIDSGISFKLYPCCAGAHVAIDCALEIAQHYSPLPDKIDAISVSIHSGTKIVLIHPRPKTVAQARFSLEYCVSRAIIDHRMGPEQFSQQKIDDPTVQSLIEKVKPRYYDAPVTTDDLAQSRFPVEIQVSMKDGSIFLSRAEYAKGTPNNPLSLTELEEKFRRCCSSKLSDSQIMKALDQLRNFGQLKDVAGMIPIFS
jgi:2-methylcitrate dehydratase PrpD